MRECLISGWKWCGLGLVVMLLGPSLAYGQSTEPVLADARTQAPSPLSSFHIDPTPPKYFSATINPNQFVTHQVDLKEVLTDFARENDCTLNEAFDSLATKLQMIPRDSVDLKQPAPGSTALRRPDSISPSPGTEKLRNAIFQVVEKDVYSITARQVFFNELEANLYQFRFGDQQIVIEVRYLRVPTKDVVKLQSFMIPNSFEAFENRLPQVAPIGTFATENEANAGNPGHASSGGTLVSATETKTKAFPTFIGHLDPSGLKQLIGYCKGHAETDLTQAPTLTVFPGHKGTVSDAAMRPFVVSVKKIRLGSRVEYQPVIQMVEEGVKLAFEAETDEGKVEFTGDLAFSSILGVETFEYPYATDKNGNKVNIQIPEHHLRRVHWSTAIDSGNTLLIDPVETSEKLMKPKTRFKKAVYEPMRQLILVTPRIIESGE